MRKTILLGTLITLFGAGALAQAKDVTATEIGSAAEASRSAVRGEEHAHERHHVSSREHHDARRGHREHHDEAHERHDERRDHGRRH